jgi:hypothetical protein
MEKTVDLQTRTDFPVKGALARQWAGEQSLCQTMPALNQADPIDLTKIPVILAFTLSPGFQARLTATSAGRSDSRIGILLIRLAAAFIGTNEGSPVIAGGGKVTLADLRREKPQSATCFSASVRHTDAGEHVAFASSGRTDMGEKRHEPRDYGYSSIESWFRSSAGTTDVGDIKAQKRQFAAAPAVF